MELILGIAIGFFIRHVLFYPDRRKALMDLFKINKDEHNDN